MRIMDLGDTQSWHLAFQRLAAAEHFPELTARLRMAAPDGSGEAEEALAIMERGFAEGWVHPKPPATRSGRTVAVVGGGMVGLAAAAALNDAGHFVRVYESSPRLGGLLLVGQGRARVEQWVIDRRVRLMEAEGVEFVVGARVGEAIGFDELKEVSDAILLAIGSRRPRQLRVPGYQHPRVIEAERLLRPGGRQQLKVEGSRALVLGDGEASERSQVLLSEGGASEVEVLPLLGGEVQWALDRRSEGAWPMLHGHSGGEPDPVQVVAVEGDGQRLRSVRLVRVDVSMEGTEPVVVPRPGSAFSVGADAVVVAAGYRGPDTRAIEQQLGLELDIEGNVAADRRFGTTVPGVYYAGDANPGASSLLWDLSQGLEAAAVIDARLGG